MVRLLIGAVGNMARARRGTNNLNAKGNDGCGGNGAGGNWLFHNGHNPTLDARGAGWSQWRGGMAAALQPTAHYMRGADSGGNGA